MLASKATADRIAKLKAAKADADEQKQWAWDHASEVYRERDLLVGALARLYPSHRMAHTKAGGKPTICIHTPAGQCAWALSDALADLLDDIPLTDNDWDRAKVADRHARLEKLSRGVSK